MNKILFFLISSFLLSTLLTTPAFAWIEVNWSAPLNPTTRTHVILVGNGAYGVGMQFAYSALSQARKIRDILPQDQILVIASQESNSSATAARYKVWEPKANVSIHGSSMLANEVIDRMTEFTQIASFYIFAHNAPMEGSSFEEYDRFNPHTYNVENLKGHFTSDSFMIIEGCNSGFDLAKSFAEIWNIPALGSLTSTNYQRLHVDGNFYSDDQGNYPSDNWKGTNNQSYNAPWKCPSGICLRMKPDVVPYDGGWGTFSGGLGFYKWYCNGVDTLTCEKAMYRHALLWVGPQNLSKNISARGVMNFVNDYFCDQDKTGTRQKNCINKIAQALNTGNRYYNNFLGKTYQCDMNHCEVDIQCLFYDCTPTEGVDRSTTMMDEIKNYVRVLKKMMGL